MPFNGSPPTKRMITNYKNAPRNAKNAVIKFSYKPHGTKTPQSPPSTRSLPCCRGPQHNWVDCEWKSPLPNYLTMLWGRVERQMWANLSASVNYAGRSGWKIRRDRLTDSATDRNGHRSSMRGGWSTCRSVKPRTSFTFPEGLLRNKTNPPPSPHILTFASFN